MKAPCSRCAQPRDCARIAYCLNCHVYMRDYWRRLRALWKSLGRCCQCGGRSERSWCGKCLGRHNERRRCARYANRAAQGAGGQG